MKFSKGERVELVPVSLSARRAWIEIRPAIEILPKGAGSLSARRAWIEIRGLAEQFALPEVALRKESVD